MKPSWKKKTIQKRRRHAKFARFNLQKRFFFAAAIAPPEQKERDRAKGPALFYLHARTTFYVNLMKNYAYGDTAPEIKARAVGSAGTLTTLQGGTRAGYAPTYTANSHIYKITCSSTYFICKSCVCMCASFQTHASGLLSRDSSVRN